MRNDLKEYIPNYNFNDFIVKTTCTDEKLNKAKKLEENSLSKNVGGFIYGAKDYIADEFINNTLFRFNNESNLKVIIKLNKIFRSVTSEIKFYYAVKEIVDVKDREWLNTEYNTAMLIAYSKRDKHKYKSQTDLFPYWRYNANCEFYPEHNILNNVILSAKENIWKYIYPIQEWCCTCYISPKLSFEVTLDELNDSLEIANRFIRSKSPR